MVIMCAPCEVAATSEVAMETVIEVTQEVNNTSLVETFALMRRTLRDDLKVDVREDWGVGNVTEHL